MFQYLYFGCVWHRRRRCRACFAGNAGAAPYIRPRKTRAVRPSVCRVVRLLRMPPAFPTFGGTNTACIRRWNPRPCPADWRFARCGIPQRATSIALNDVARAVIRSPDNLPHTGGNNHHRHHQFALVLGRRCLLSKPYSASHVVVIQWHLHLPAEGRPTHEHLQRVALRLCKIVRRKITREGALACIPIYRQLIRSQPKG